MTLEQYETLVKLMRGSLESPGNRAARRVLVDGVTKAQAARETGASRSTVGISVQRYTLADQTVRSAYGVPPNPSAQPGKRATKAGSEESPSIRARKESV